MRHIGCADTSWTLMLTSPFPSSCNSIGSRSWALRSERLQWMSRLSFSISRSPAGAARSAPPNGSSPSGAWVASASTSRRAARSARIIACTLARSPGSGSAASAMAGWNHIRSHQTSSFAHPPSLAASFFVAFASRCDMTRPPSGPPDARGPAQQGQ